MANISYETVTESGHTFVKVRLGRKLIGEIRAAGGGYRYLPKGSSMMGDVFPTVVDVKRSIEGAT